MKDKQTEAVKSFVCGNDVFVSLPTGSGKSLCFALLPGVFDILRPRKHDAKSLVIIVSPLIALYIMKDQVSNFKKKTLSYLRDVQVHFSAFEFFLYLESIVEK